MMSDNVIMSVAIGTFIANVHQRLPPYWYSLAGGGMGSLACLFGNSEANMSSLLLKANMLFWYKEKDKELEMRFKKHMFVNALLLIPIYTEGFEAASSRLDEPLIKCLRSNKAAPPKKKQWFIHIGCTAVATRNWIAHQSAAKQVARCQRPPGPVSICPEFFSWSAV
jgi:hypothetical protein